MTQLGQLFFCAEISSNHNGSLARSLELIRSSASAGFDSVKFQLFRIDDLFAKECQHLVPDIEKRRQWELPPKFIRPLANEAHNQGLAFSCTPFDLRAVDEVAPYVDFLKIASYELLWTDLLNRCAQTGLPIVLSTGMATLTEIEAAVETLAQGGCRQLTLLHCVSAYPAPVLEVNLNAIETMRSHFNVPVGWSDHTNSEAVIHRAVHRWNAEFIELHFDIDSNGAESAQGHCWLPESSKRVITAARQGMALDGSSAKAPVESEAFERKWRADPKDGLRPLMSQRKTF